MTPTPRWRPRLIKVLAGVTGALLSCSVAYAATAWTVGLNSGSSATAQGSGIQLLTISQVVNAPSLTNLLAPGATGDVRFTLQNPNPFPVWVRGVTLPTTANHAVGHSTSTLNAPIGGCSASGGTASQVTWTGAGASTVAKSFASSFAVAGGATVTVTLTGAASMGSSSPLACAGTSSGTSPNLTYAGAWFVMPSLVTVDARGGTDADHPAAPLANNATVTTSLL